jgi:hypothetical protein
MSSGDSTPEKRSAKNARKANAILFKVRFAPEVSG